MGLLSAASPAQQTAMLPRAATRPSSSSRMHLGFGQQGMGASSPTWNPCRPQHLHRHCHRHRYGIYLVGQVNLPADRNHSRVGLPSATFPAQGHTGHAAVLARALTRPSAHSTSSCMHSVKAVGQDCQQPDPPSPPPPPASSPPAQDNAARWGWCWSG